MVVMKMTKTIPTERRRSAFSFTGGIAATLAAGIAFSAVVVGAAAVPTATVAQSTEFQAITPCRLMDTRPGVDNVGPRATPVGAGETHVQQVTGDNGNCKIPATATAVALNATAVGGTEISFLTFFPDDAPLPLSSNLNVAPGQPPTPNKVDVRLSVSGSVGIYNAFGQVNVIVDVMGYYLPIPRPIQPYASDARGSLTSLADEPKPVVGLWLEPEADGAVVVSSTAVLTANGARGVCAISEGATMSQDHRQIADIGVLGAETLAGTRTFQVQADDEFQVQLICQREGGLVTVTSSHLSGIFVPSYVAPDNAEATSS